MTTSVVKTLVAIVVARVKRWAWLIWRPHIFKGWRGMDIHYCNKLIWIGVTNGNDDKNIEFWSDKSIKL